MKNLLTFTRIQENSNRQSTLLQNDLVRLLINDKGGMTPEFSIKTNNGYLNTHWVPGFRANNPQPFEQEKHADFWKTDLLYSISGSFPCAPSFGPEHWDERTWHPTHGWAANNIWQYQAGGTARDLNAVYAVCTMRSPDPAFPLSMKKIDLLIEGQPIHYSAIRTYNQGPETMTLNIGFHNTMGSPFLQAGNIISLCANHFATPPKGGEFDDTGRLAIGTEFSDLKHAPLRNGKYDNISLIPGMIGYSDFVSGCIPENIDIGWSSVVNPVLKLAYICFFNSQKYSTDDEIALHFNDLWLQYGGRNFTPWATYNGAPDSTFCLATENAIGAYATGLRNAKNVKKVLGAPTTFEIPPNTSKILYYGTMLAEYPGNILDEGTKNIQRAENSLLVQGNKTDFLMRADIEFSVLKAIDELDD